MIVGGGFFLRHTFLPLSIAWEAFGENNGVDDVGRLREMIRRRRSDGAPDPTIGCIILVDPFFFDREEWIPAPRDWSPNIVQGKGYDTATVIGAELWEMVSARLAVRAQHDSAAYLHTGARYGEPQLIRNRLGQGGFRVMVTEAYGRRCAITGEKTLPVLQAAHIKPFVDAGPHAVPNGLLLRSDLHLLFDRGLITVTPDHVVHVSERIRKDYGNGRIYYPLDGEPMRVLPNAEEDRPLGSISRGMANAYGWGDEGGNGFRRCA